MPVNQKSLKTGLRVCYRKGRKAGTPLEQVEIVDGIVRNRQVKVRFIDHDADGWTSWVRPEQLVCLWSKRKAFLRFEERSEKLEADWRAKYDPALWDAMQSVVVATGDSGGFLKGWQEPSETFDRLWLRAGLTEPPLSNPLAYKMGAGVLRLPWDTALTFCEAFCAKEPAIVLSLVEGRRRDFLARGHEPGEQYYHSLMREYAASDAVVKDWCGGEAARQDLRDENDRLRRLVQEGAAALERAGDSAAGRRLLRGLRSG